MGNHGGKDKSTCDLCSKEFRNKVFFASPGRKQSTSNHREIVLFSRWAWGPTWNWCISWGDNTLALTVGKSSTPASEYNLGVISPQETIEIWKHLWHVANWWWHSSFNWWAKNCNFKAELWELRANVKNTWKCKWVVNMTSIKMRLYLTTFNLHSVDLIWLCMKCHLVTHFAHLYTQAVCTLYRTSNLFKVKQFWTETGVFVIGEMYTEDTENFISCSYNYILHTYAQGSTKEKGKI